MAATDIVSLADAKAQLNITDNVSDAELAGFISAVTAPIEDHVGAAIINRTVTEVFDGGTAQLSLSCFPVVSVTSVTESGSVLEAAGYTINKDSGILTRVAGISALAFLPGHQSVSVVYIAGQAANIAAVEPNIRMAALIMIQHLWETQRPAAQGPFSQAGDDYDPRYAHAIPRKAFEVLGERMGGFA